VACFAVAQWIGGSGFIACFVGCLLFGRIVSKQHKHKLLLTAEGTGDTLALITWIVFGIEVFLLSLIWMLLFIRRWTFEVGRWTLNLMLNVHLL
jgi:NhaP-type Na+/H+ and K+/H+ antiporter